LLALAMALKVSIEDLIPLRKTQDEDDERRFVIRRTNRERIEIADGVTWERLNTDALETGVEFLELVYSPSASSGTKLYTHEGREMTLITEGEMIVEVAFERYRLVAGDSISFASTTPHRYSNRTDKVTRGVTVMFQALGAESQEATALLELERRRTDSTPMAKVQDQSRRARKT
jgi:uncharacterized cupin superfamily protein